MISIDGIETVKSIYSQNLSSFLEETYLHTNKSNAPVSFTYLSHSLYYLIPLHVALLRCYTIHVFVPTRITFVTSDLFLFYLPTLTNPGLKYVKPAVISSPMVNRKASSDS